MSKFWDVFIDYILEYFCQDVIIGHEVMYGSDERFADLAFFIKGTILSHPLR